MSNGQPTLLEPTSQAEPPLLTKDSSRNPTNQPQWGIFLTGSRAIIPDNIISFEFKQDFRVAEYPMEEGGFQNYNKVNTPYDARVRMSKGGTESDRQQFLDDIEALADSLELCDVVTPEKIYLSANLNHFDYHRTATNGVGLITVDVWLIEIRETISAKFSNTKQPSGASPTTVGTVQPQTPKDSQTLKARQ